MRKEKQRSRRGTQGVNTDECLICFEKKQKYADLYAYFWDEDPLCQGCRGKLKRVNQTISLSGLSCEILYEYNDAFSALLIQYKELYDEALYPVFLSPFVQRLRKKYRGYTLVYVPSTEAKQKERGFAHVPLLYEALKLPGISPFLKLDGPAQKTASRLARYEVKQYLQRDTSVILPATPLLLVDDVVTTGASMIACYQLLQHHPYPIRALCAGGNTRLLSEKGR